MDIYTEPGMAKKIWEWENDPENYDEYRNWKYCHHPDTGCGCNFPDKDEDNE